MSNISEQDLLDEQCFGYSWVRDSQGVLAPLGNRRTVALTPHETLLHTFQNLLSPHLLLHIFLLHTHAFQIKGKNKKISKYSIKSKRDVIKDSPGNWLPSFSISKAEIDGGVFGQRWCKLPQRDRHEIRGTPVKSLLRRFHSRSALRNLFALRHALKSAKAGGLW